MPDVLELLPLYLAWNHPQGRVFPLQSLHTGQLIGAQRPFSLLDSLWCLAIHGVDVLYLLIKVLIRDWIQPIAHLMGFEIGLFLKASPRVAAR